MTEHRQQNRNPTHEGAEITDLGLEHTEAIAQDDLAFSLDQLWSGDKRMLRILAPFVPTDDDQRCGNYLVTRVIGVGSFGIVYKATDERSNHTVALKIPRRDVLADQSQVRRFEIEAECTRNLDHPGIVRVDEADLLHDPPFIAMQYCAGPNLAQWIEENGRVDDPQTAVKVILQIADAIGHAHSQGVLHRDLKPSNVLLVATCDKDEPVLEDYDPRITDFGLARVLNTGLSRTRSSLVIGTPLYMAPEQANCKAEDIGPPADLYALGAILYELLTGQPPFASENYAALILRIHEETPASIREVRDDVSPGLDAICRKCLESSIANRFQSTDDLTQELQRYLDGKTPQTRFPGAIQRLRSWCQRPSSLSSLCVLVGMISLVRIAFSICGLILVNSIGTPPTVKENLLILVGHLSFSTPFEFWTIFSANRHRRSKLSRSTYLILLGLMWAIAMYTFAVAFGWVPSPPWYERMPNARLMVFLLIGILFVIQVVCWVLLDNWPRKFRDAQPRSKAWLLAPLSLMMAAVVWSVSPMRTAEYYPGPPQAMTFDGVDDFVTVSSAGFAAGDQITIEGWIQPEGNQESSIASSGPFVLCAMPAGRNEFKLRLVVVYKDESMLLIDAVEPIAKSKWNHVAAGYDGARVGLFVNGVPTTMTTYGLNADGTGSETEIPSQITLEYPAASGPVYVGITNPNGHRAMFQGKIGEFRISTNLRYKQSFQPRISLEPDSSTKLFLQLNDRATLEDGSGKYRVEVNR